MSSRPHRLSWSGRRHRLALGLVLGAVAPLAAGTVQDEPTPGAVASTVYHLTVNGQPVFVEHFKDVSYARFAFRGRADVVVTVAAPFADFVLSPLRLGLPVRRQDRTLAFSLAEPRNLILQCEGLEKLFLFAEPPEAHPPAPGAAGVVNVLDYVRDRTGATNQRDGIQRALDAVAARPGGGTLFFPAGTYLTGTIVVRSGVTVYLAAGALLQGTANPADYYVPGARPGPGGTGALIYFFHATDAKLTGRGTVASRGTLLRQRVPDHPRICNLVDSRRCEISDVVLRDSGGFNIHLLRCEDVVLRDYKIVNDLDLSNQDGTDPDSSRHVLIDGVFMYTSDDAIAVKADVGLCEDVRVRNCVLWTRKSALKVGSDPYWGARDIVFEHNDVVHADRALALYARRGFIEHARYLDNVAEFVGDDTKRQTIVFLVSKVGPGGETARAADGPDRGTIHDVLVDGLLACRLSPKASVIRGDGPARDVGPVIIRNYFVGGRPVRSAADGDIEVGPDAHDVSFEITRAAPAAAAALRLPDWAK